LSVFLPLALNFCIVSANLLVSLLDPFLDYSLLLGMMRQNEALNVPIEITVKKISIL
jgi:hypothetical protein